MTLLFIYLGVSIGISFLCSLVEASLLTVSRADGTFLARQGKASGRHLEEMKDKIDRPLAAILTLNTCAHTVGAAGVGAQSLALFGKEWVAVTSAVLTLAILVLSEIIPKTIGASYAKPLIPFTVFTVRWMIWLCYPLIILLNMLSKLLTGSGHAEGVLSREHFAVMADLAGTQGSLSPEEASIVQQTLRLRDVRVSEIMTPRTAMFMLSRSTTVGQAIVDSEMAQFSRVPVFGEGPDDVLGITLKHDIFAAAVRGERSRRIESMLRPIHAVPEMAPVMRILEEFGRLGHHLFLVVDEYGGTAGLVTLEDVLETVLGREIVDETDSVADLRSTVTTEQIEPDPTPGALGADD